MLVSSDEYVVTLAKESGTSQEFIKEWLNTDDMNDNVKNMKVTTFMKNDHLLRIDTERKLNLQQAFHALQMHTKRSKEELMNALSIKESDLENTQTLFVKKMAAMFEKFLQDAIALRKEINNYMVDNELYGAIINEEDVDSETYKNYNENRQRSKHGERKEIHDDEKNGFYKEKFFTFITSFIKEYEIVLGKNKKTTNYTMFNVRMDDCVGVLKLRKPNECPTGMVGVLGIIQHIEESYKKIISELRKERYLPKYKNSF